MAPPPSPYPYRKAQLCHSHPLSLQETSPVNVRDPCGSSFAQSDGMSEGDTNKRSPASDDTPGGYYFDPLPQRQKRGRATTAMSRKNDGAPVKRRGVDGGGQGDVAGAENYTRRAVLGNTVGEKPRSGAVATPGRNHKEEQQTLEVGFNVWVGNSTGLMLDVVALDEEYQYSTPLM